MTRKTYQPNGKKIKQIRNSKGWTQAELAEEAGYTERAIQRLEAGARTDNKAKLEDVSEVLDVDIAELLLPDDTASSPASFSTEDLNRIFEIRHQRNPYFTGRIEILNELYRRWFEGDGAGKQAICGLGGIGKTQLAIQYAYKYQKEYQAIFWVDADTKIQLTESYVGIAKRLGLPFDESQREEVVFVVKQWLSTNTKWLLIFDNADHPNLLREYLPSKSTGHILLTSRVNRPDLLGVVHPIEIPKLSIAKSTDFLLARTNRSAESPEKDFAEMLAKDIDGLPLALEQAGAYIMAMNIRFDQYYSEFTVARRKVEMLDRQDPIAGNYSSTVATTWMVNFREVEKESEMTADILRFSCFLDPDCIPFEVVIAGVAEFAPSLHKRINDANDPVVVIAEALEPLARFSLVHIDRDNETYSMHRLVQEVVKIRDET